MLDLHAVIIRHNITLTYEVLVCKLMRINGTCLWHVIEHRDLYISQALAETAAKEWCRMYGYLYLGIKKGYANFPLNETELTSGVLTWISA